MNTRTAASRLRLSSARRRIASFIEQIDILAESSFPHNDGRKVLATIREEFQKLTRLVDLPPTATDALADRVCLGVALRISEFTEILGLVLRSTNVRNSFELHYVLKAMVEQVLGQQTDLLISSEWAFVPFTYPIGLDLLPDVVLIGSPAPESENPLIVPLAGHEIGHSAWRVTDAEADLSVALLVEVDAAISANRPAAPEQEDDLVARSRVGVVRDRCAAHALNQLEEVYCDLIGLYLFGPSYLYAFDYLLGPGGADRSLDYPSDSDRVVILVTVAGELGIEVDPALHERWTPANSNQDERRLTSIVDQAVAAMIPQLKAHVLDFVKGRGLTPPSGADIDRVYAAFRRHQPYAEHASLGAIISAGWKMLRNEGDLTADGERATFKVLCDLIWKTIEVTEYLEKGRVQGA
jgi:hypothetical protein